MSTGEHNRHSDAEDAFGVVEAHLAADGDLSDGSIEALLARHPDRAEDLRRAIEAVRVTRQAQQKAKTPDTSESSTFPISTLSGLLADEPGWSLDGYAIGDRIGGGKFGEVYEAVALESGKLVAVKCLRREYRDHPQALTRFQIEAEVLSRLEHPGIVRVIEVRATDPVPCIIMERINGRDLHRATRGVPMEPMAAATIIADVADACHAAHTQNTLHRDIKPENILLDETGRPRITDYGLAKQLDRDVELTGSDQSLGTPHYMPPEQAEPSLGPTTAQADVYAIGGTLYFLLTGRAPFPIEIGTGREETLHQIAWARPHSPHRWNEHIPSDLALICLMCLEKRPHDRYRDALSLADDLRRFLEGRPVKARLPGVVGRAWRWSARRPGYAAMLLLAFASLSGGSVAAVYYALEASGQRALTAQAQAGEYEATHQRILRAHFADMRDAQLALDAGRTDEAGRLLAKYENAQLDPDPRGFEWGYLQQRVLLPSPFLLEADGSQWSRVRIGPGGRILAAIDQSGRLSAIDTKSGDVIFRHDTPLIDIAMDVSGERLAALTVADYYSNLLVFDLSNGNRLVDIDTGMMATALAFSHDGSKCFVGDINNGLMLFDLSSGRETDLAEDLRYNMPGNPSSRSFDIQHGAVTAAAFSPDDTKLAIGYTSGGSQVWDLPNRRIVSRMWRQPGEITGITFDADGKRVASQSFGEYDNRLRSNVHGDICVWNVADGSHIQTVIPHQKMLEDRPFRVTGVAGRPFGLLCPLFHPDGDRLITTGPTAIIKWGIESGRLTGLYRGGGSTMIGLDVSPDGRFVAGVELEGHIRVWPIEDAGPEHTIYSAYAGIRAMARQGDSLVLLRENSIELTTGFNGKHYSRSDRRLVTVVDLDNLHAKDVADASEGVDSLAVTSNLIINRNKSLGTEENSALIELLEREVDRQIIAVSDSEALLAIGERDGSIRLLDVLTGRELWSRQHHDGAITALVFSTDGTQLAAGSSDRRVSLLGVDGGEALASFRGHSREVSGIAFSPDGTRLATSSGLLSVMDMASGEVCVWHIGTEQLSLRLASGAAEAYTGVAWSQDGLKLYAAANPLSDADGRVEPGRVVVWSASAEH